MKHSLRWCHQSPDQSQPHWPPADLLEKTLSHHASIQSLIVYILYHSSFTLQYLALSPVCVLLDGVFPWGLLKAEMFGHYTLQQSLKLYYSYLYEGQSSPLSLNNPLTVSISRKLEILTSQTFPIFASGTCSSDTSLSWGSQTVAVMNSGRAVVLTVPCCLLQLSSGGHIWSNHSVRSSSDFWTRQKYLVFTEGARRSERHQQEGKYAHIYYIHYTYVLYTNIYFINIL